MTKLLHVSASPRGATSDSLALAGAFADSYRAANPEVIL
jgi:FMN-dependent NADH-azoreductase